MRRHRHLVAQHIVDTGEDDTYDQLLLRCIRTALHLQSRKLTKDDIVVLCSHNQKNSAVPFIASLFLNVTVASLDPSLSLIETAHLVNEVKPKIIFAVPEAAKMIETALERSGTEAEIIIFGKSDEHTEFSSFLEPHEGEAKFTPKKVDSLQDTAVIFFSSGTTGLPKGIMINHYALMAQADVMIKYGNLTSVSLSYATLYWISAVLYLVALTQTGGAKLLVSKFDPEEIWYLIDKYKVSNLFAAPSLVISMLKVGRPEGINTTSLYICVLGGTPMPEKQLLELRDLLPGTFVFQGYGQTEVGGFLTWFRTNSVKETLYLHSKPKSVGMFVPGYKYKVVNRETENICGPNEEGELMVKTKYMMNGYYKRDSSESLDSSGWLKTGDIVYYDEDGCFYIVDRIKEMLKYKSWHVAPAMLEQVLMAHPAVGQAVVIGIPEGEDDLPMALIVPKESQIADVDKQDILNFVEARVPDRMRLRGGVKIISNVPMTPSGKIKRKDLRNMVLNELSSITDLNDENYIFEIPIEFEPDQRGLGNFFFNNMRKYRQLVSQYITDTGEEDTYEQLLQRSIRTALHLESRNLTKDDVIVLCLDNQKDSVVPFIASVFLNVPVASLDPSLSLIDTAHLLNEVKPKMIFIIPEVLDMIETSFEQAGILVGLNAEIVIFGESDVYTEFSSFLEPHEDEEKFAPKEVDSLQDTAIILFSSGTTGLPKGIMLSNYALMVQAHNMIKSGNMGAVKLSYATLYWISTVVYVVVAVQTGAAKLVVSKCDPLEAWYLIEKYKVTNCFAAPPLAMSMIKVGRPDGIDTTSLWSFIIGGGAIPEKRLLELRDLLPGTFVFMAYGQTEVGGLLTWFRTNHVKDTLLLHTKPTSIGKLAPGIRGKVIDPETEDICGPNEEGELRVKTKSVMNGYYNRDSSETFDNDGWLKTGDIVYYDEDECFYIVDRIKEMLKYKSFHVAPAMLEHILLTHPAVAQVVVIGIPDEEDGDHPMALIVPTESSNGNVNEEDFINFVEERVPDRMRLRGGVKIIDSVPMTPSGKIKRKHLRTMVLNGDI